MHGAILVCELCLPLHANFANWILVKQNELHGIAKQVLKKNYQFHNSQKDAGMAVVNKYANKDCSTMQTRIAAHNHASLLFISSCKPNLCAWWRYWQI